MNLRTIAWIKKKAEKTSFELATKSKEELVKTFYPYAIMLAVAILLTIGSFLVFSCLPRYKDTVHSTEVNEQKTVYSDETMSFVGLSDLQNFDDLAKANMPSSADKEYASEIADIISLIYSDASPKSEDDLVGKFTYYTFGGASVPTDDDADYSGHDFHSSYKGLGSSDSRNNMSTNFTGYSEGILLVAQDVRYTAESGQDYCLSIISCGDNFYYFNIMRADDNNLSAEDFYRVISELDVNSWNSEAGSLRDVFANLSSDYLSGNVYSGSKQDYINNIESVIQEDDEVRRFFERLTSVALDYNDELGCLNDYYSFSGIKLPKFVEKACKALEGSSKKTLDGSSIIISSDTEFYGGYKLGFVYDLHSGEISGFGLCK